MWVKLLDASCTICWGRGTVTKVLSQNKVIDNGEPASCTRYTVSLPSDEEVVDEVPQEEPVRRSQREQRRPAWMEE